MSESKIQKKMIDYLESKGAYVVKVVSANKKGVPDILCCYKGRFIAIEVKRPETKNNVSKLQKHNLQKVEKAEGLALVAWELSQVEEFLQEI